ncbi:MAG: hypothetical protein ACRDYZ_05070 [Acidimicrobiales bacterium]
MLISYVLRLRPDALADGRFVGEIEAVTTRRRRSVRSVDQVASFVLQTTPTEVDAIDSLHTAPADGHPATGQREAARLGPRGALAP